MKVGILTFHFSDNYGAALQAYALRRWFIQNGHEASFVDYRPRHIEHGGVLRLPTSPAILKSNLKVIYLTASSLLNQYFGSKSQREKFARFRQEFLAVKDRPLSQTDETALSEAQAFDLLVAGSDQIWSPSQHFGFDPNYFLAFARPFRARRISYAASFGRDRLTPVEAGQLRELLKYFDAISVREISGVALVETAIGVKPVNVPDPTLLHTDYSDLCNKSVPKAAGDYIFCYALRSPGNVRQTAEEVSRRLGCPILSPHNPHRRWAEIGETVHPDPAEWVSLLMNSRFVVTNSFHGTVFSLLFRKPFIVAGLTGNKASANARATNLLRDVHLENRFAASFSHTNVDGMLKEQIDWENVEKLLVELRQRGSQFLDQQLKSAMP